MKRRRTAPTRRTQLWIPITVVIILLILSAFRNCQATSQKSHQQQPTASPIAEELMKVTMPKGEANEIVDYYGYTLSFNPKLHIPNWVAWELTGDEASGAHSRSNNFAEDPNVKGCALPADYRNSGYDRGHMCPAGDMKWSPDAMSQTFFMTNMCPQAHTLNSGSWKSLEEKCRVWAKADSAIIIICGPVLTKDPIEYIGASGVAVPAEFFKVVLAPYSKPMRGIGFIMPNGKVPGGMQKAAVSIDEVERITGYDFFSALPDDVESQVESQCQFHYWNTIR